MYVNGSIKNEEKITCSVLACKIDDPSRRAEIVPATKFVSLEFNKARQQGFIATARLGRPSMNRADLSTPTSKFYSG